MMNTNLLGYIPTLTQISVVAALKLITLHSLVSLFYKESLNSLIFLLYIYI
jgi:hypothetical protein